MITTDFRFTIDPVRKLDGLARALRNKAIRIAMNKAAAAVKRAVIAAAPIRYGFLAKSMKIKIKNYKGGKYKDSAIWIAMVGPGRKFQRQKGTITRGEHKGEPYKKRPSNYSRLVSQGTKFAKPTHFLDRALADSIGQYRQILTSSLREQISAALRG